MGKRIESSSKWKDEILTLGCWNAKYNSTSVLLTFNEYGSLQNRFCNPYPYCIAGTYFCFLFTVCAFLDITLSLNVSVWIWIWSCISQVTPNLYGNLVANTAAGIAGGTGVMPGGTCNWQSEFVLSILMWICFRKNSCIFHPLYSVKWSYSSFWLASCGSGNVGADHAVFEQGASAGNVGNEKILEQKKANPIALFLSSAMMLRHLQFPSFADRLETSVKRVIAEGKYMTKDLGGDCTTQEITDAVIANLD